FHCVNPFLFHLPKNLSEQPFELARTRVHGGASCRTCSRATRRNSRRRRRRDRCTLRRQFQAFVDRLPCLVRLSVVLASARDQFRELHADLQGVVPLLAVL